MHKSWIEFIRNRFSPFKFNFIIFCYIVKDRIEPFSNWSVIFAVLLLYSSSFNMQALKSTINIFKSPLFLLDIVDRSCFHYQLYSYSLKNPCHHNAVLHDYMWDLKFLRNKVWISILQRAGWLGAMCKTFWKH